MTEHLHPSTAMEASNPQSPISSGIISKSDTNLSHDMNSMAVVGDMMLETTPTSKEALDCEMTLQTPKNVADVQSIKVVTSDAEIKLALTTLPPLEEFTLFSALPPELRGHIWKLAPYEERLIDVRSPKQDQDIVYSIIFSNCMPASLHVCRESRYIFSQLYELVPTVKGWAYVSWARDHFVTHLSLRRQGGHSPTKKIEFYKKCRHLVTYPRWWDDRDIRRAPACLGEFTALRSIKSFICITVENKRTPRMIIFPVTNEAFCTKHSQIHTPTGEKDFIKEWKEAINISEKNPCREVPRKSGAEIWEWILNLPA